MKRAGSTPSFQLPITGKETKFKLTASALAGKVVRIPGTVGIKWRILPADQKTHHQKSMLVSLPNGHVEYKNTVTLISEIARDELEIVLDYTPALGEVELKALLNEGTVLA